MPLPLIPIFLIGGAVLTVAVTYWAAITEWFSERAAPWLEQHVPALAPHLKKAFIAIDQHVATPLRRAIKRAWSAVRQYLLEATMTYKKSDGVWVQRNESYLQDQIGPGSKIIKRVEETPVAWDDLPESVRAAALARRQQATSVDLIKTRDAEVHAMVQA